MIMRARSARTWAAVLAVSLLANASFVAADEEKPWSFKSLLRKITPGGEAPAKESPAKEGTDELRVREITKVSTVASVVLDRSCPEPVQSYKLSENLLSLGWFTLKTGAASTAKRLLGGQGGPGLGGVKGDLLVAAKLGAKQLNWLPMSAEVLYGEKLHEEMEPLVLGRDSERGKQFYPIADGMLRDILSKIDQPHEYEFKLFISTDGNGNAMARPGGFLYVDDDLISKPALRPKAQFALSHEVAHVLQRHETKELQSTIVDSIPDGDDLVKLVREVARNPRAILAHVKLRKDLFTRHHVDQELHADSCGARLLGRALGDLGRLAASLNAFINAMPRAEREPPKPAPKTEAEKLTASVQDLVDTPVKRHPSTEERRRNLQAIYDDITRKDTAGR